MNCGALTVLVSLCLHCLSKHLSQCTPAELETYIERSPAALRAVLAQGVDYLLANQLLLSASVAARSCAGLHAYDIKVPFKSEVHGILSLLRQEQASASRGAAELFFREYAAEGIVGCRRVLCSSPEQLHLLVALFSPPDGAGLVPELQAKLSMDHCSGIMLGNVEMASHEVHPPPVAASGHAHIDEIRELDYLTHIILKLYEVSYGDGSKRWRVRLLLSRGVMTDYGAAGSDAGGDGGGSGGCGDGSDGSDGGDCGDGDGGDSGGNGDGNGNGDGGGDNRDGGAPKPSRPKPPRPVTRKSSWRANGIDGSGIGVQATPGILCEVELPVEIDGTGWVLADWERCAAPRLCNAVHVHVREHGHVHCG